MRLTVSFVADIFLWWRWALLSFTQAGPDAVLGRTIWGVLGLGAFGFQLKEVPAGKHIITTTRSHSNKLVTDCVAAMNPDNVLRVGGAGNKVPRTCPVGPAVFCHWMKCLLQNALSTQSSTHRLRPLNANHSQVWRWGPAVPALGRWSRRNRSSRLSVAINQVWGQPGLQEPLSQRNQVVQSIMMVPNGVVGEARGEGSAVSESTS